MEGSNFHLDKDFVSTQVISNNMAYIQVVPGYGMDFDDIEKAHSYAFEHESLKTCRMCFYQGYEPDECWNWDCNPAIMDGFKLRE